MRIFPGLLTAACLVATPLAADEITDTLNSALAAYEAGDQDAADKYRDFDGDGKPDDKDQVRAVSNEFPLAPAAGADPPAVSRRRAAAGAEG